MSLLVSYYLHMAGEASKPSSFLIKDLIGDVIDSEDSECSLFIDSAPPHVPLINDPLWTSVTSATHFLSDKQNKITIIFNNK